MNSDEGGKIYYGVNDDKTIHGISDTDIVCQQISNSLRDMLLSSVMVLLDLHVGNIDEKNIIVPVLVAIITALMVGLITSYSTKIKNKFFYKPDELGILIKHIIDNYWWWQIGVSTIQFVIYQIFDFDTAVMGAVIVSLICYIHQCCKCIKILIKQSREEGIVFRGLSRVKKIAYIFLITVPSIVIVVSFGMVGLLSSYSFGKIIENLEAKAYSNIFNVASIYLLACISNILGLKIMQKINKCGEEKKVKKIKVIYMEGQDKKEEKNVMYDYFDINKSIVKFYSSDHKCNVVINRKDLIKIEYYYD